MRLLSKSWAGPWLLLGILVGFWEALGLSWAAPGLLLGTLGLSWAALGRSWATLGRLLGTLGQLWSDLGRQVGAKMEPKRRKVDPKTPKNRGQDGPR